MKNIEASLKFLELNYFTATSMGPNQVAVERLKRILRLERGRTTMMTRETLQQLEPEIFTDAVFCDRSNYANH